MSEDQFQLYIQACIINAYKIKYLKVPFSSSLWEDVDLVDKLLIECFETGQDGSRFTEAKDY